VDGREGKLPGGIRQRLTLWARQHAWLHTTPRRKEEPGRKSGAAGPAPKARIEAFLEAREHGQDPPELDLPDTGADQCLIDWLFEAGAIRWTENGPCRLGWPDLLAWQTMTQTALTTWQAATIAELSVAYAASAGAALDPLCPPPIAPVVQAQTVDAQIMALFSAFASPAETEE